MSTARRDISIKQLLVNDENYRFEPVSGESEAIQLMLKKKGSEIVVLATHIIENGLDEAKSFRVLKLSETSYVVLDGNRRTTALKCLHDPNIIIDKKLKAVFQKLAEGKKLIDKVNCIVYSDETEAYKWVKLDHTGKNNGAGQESWGSTEVDRFKFKIEGKRSPGLQLVTMVEKAVGKKIDTDKIKMTTVNRILSTPEVREILGIEINNGNVTATKDIGIVVQRADKLFGKIIKDDLKVETVYTKEKRIEFVKKLFNLPLEEAKTESVEKEPMIEQEVPAETPTISKRSNPKTTNRSYLIPQDCVLKIDNKSIPKINNIYKELKHDLLIDDSTKAVPNAAGVMFRVFLEVSLDYYAIKNQYGFSANATISQKIPWVVNHLVAAGHDKKKFSNISKVGSASGSASYLSIEHFHSYVHSGVVQPTPSELKLKWDNLQEFFEILWSSL